MKQTRVSKKIGLLALICVCFLGTAFANPQKAPLNRGEEARYFRAGQQAMTEGRFAAAVQEFLQVLRFDPELSEAQIDLGLAYHLLGDYRKAAAALRQGLERNPNVLGADIVLGIDELKLGSPSLAVVPLKRAVHIDPSNRRAQQALANANLALGRYLEADRAYRAAFGGGRNQAASWFHLGKAYLQMSSQLITRMNQDSQNGGWLDRMAGDLFMSRQSWSDAERKYQAALVLSPLQPGLHVSLGNALLAQGKLQEAAEQFKRALRLVSGDPEALLGMAQVDLEQGHPDRALHSVTMIAGSSPKFLQCRKVLPLINLGPEQAANLAAWISSHSSGTGARYLLAVLDGIQGHTIQEHRHWLAMQSTVTGSKCNQEVVEQTACGGCASQACIRSLESHHPFGTKQQLALGRTYFALKQYNDAADMFASAFAKDRGDSETEYWLAAAYMRLASDYFSRLTAAFPDSAETHALRAATYHILGRNSEAIKEYQTASSIRPNEASFHEALGELFLDKHQLNLASQELAEALALEPNRARSLYLMGRVDIGKHQLKDAIDCLQRALQYDPGLVEAHASLGIAYLQAGKPSLAVRQLEKSASLDHYGDLHYMLYRAYREMGKMQLARAALATSQALRRKTEEAAQAKLGNASEH